MSWSKDDEIQSGMMNSAINDTRALQRRVDRIEARLSQIEEALMRFEQRLSLVANNGGAAQG
jgi:hypothetical protein